MLLIRILYTLAIFSLLIFGSDDIALICFVGVLWFESFFFIIRFILKFLLRIMAKDVFFMHAPTKLGKHSSVGYDLPIVVKSPLDGMQKGVSLDGSLETDFLSEFHEYR